MNRYSFFTHPNSVCMTYVEHMKLSLGFSKTLMVASFQALTHAFLPNTFVTSTTDIHAKIGVELKEAGCHKTSDSKLN